MRIFLLRLLIASWMIPTSWVIVWPMLVLLEGAAVATRDIKSFNHSLWNGI